MMKKMDTQAYLHVFRKIEELSGVKLQIEVMNADMESALAAALRQWNPNVKIVYCQDPGSDKNLIFMKIHFSHKFIFVNH